MAGINVTWLQLVAAFFVAFILAHMTTRYLERYEQAPRFPAPLVTPGPELTPWVQGRDYIPHRLKPTAPPGPATPEAQQVDAQAYETTPPVQLSQMLPTPPAKQPGDAPKLPYAMTNDDFLTFLAPSSTAPR